MSLEHADNKREARFLAVAFQSFPAGRCQRGCSPTKQGKRVLCLFSWDNYNAEVLAAELSCRGGDALRGTSGCCCLGLPASSSVSVHVKLVIRGLSLHRSSL